MNKKSPVVSLSLTVLSVMADVILEDVVAEKASGNGIEPCSTASSAYNSLKFA